eukprot:g56108.t1
MTVVTPPQAIASSCPEQMTIAVRSTREALRAFDTAACGKPQGAAGEVLAVIGGLVEKAIQVDPQAVTVEALLAAMVDPQAVTVEALLAAMVDLQAVMVEVQLAAMVDLQAVMVEVQLTKMVDLQGVMVEVQLTAMVDLQAVMVVVQLTKMGGHQVVMVATANRQAAMLARQVVMAAVLIKLPGAIRVAHMAEVQAAMVEAMGLLTEGLCQ